MNSRVVIGNRRCDFFFLRLLPFLLLAVLLAVPQVATIAGYLFLQQHAQELPPTPALDRWREWLPQTTVLQAADGTILAEIPFRRPDHSGHRRRLAYENVPPRLVQAFLAAEDVRFFRHRGVDIRAIVRAALANYRQGRIVEGASTITQQLTRNLLPRLLGKERSFVRKLREAMIALRLERRFAKHRILEVYLNQVFLGAGSYGVVAAGQAYFDRSVSQLTLAQAALIAGLAQAPTRLNPYHNLEGARLRRNEVLTRMVRAGFIETSQANDAIQEPIVLGRRRVRYGTLAPWIAEYARRVLKREYGNDYVAGGLVVETTAQPVLSVIAQTLTRNHVASLGTPAQPVSSPQIAAAVWDHHSGYVEAALGGISWQESKYDRLQQSCRQPGSTFKPLVYAAALEADIITPGSALRDAPISYYDEDRDVHWKPTNSGRSFQGVVLAQEALAQSLNAPVIDVLDRITPAKVLSFATRMGITSSIADVRPMALGASCMKPVELGQVFSVFAQQGVYKRPTLMTRVYRDDRVIFDRATPSDPMVSPDRRLDRIVHVSALSPWKRVLDRGTSFLMSSMLREVVVRGTGKGARKLGRPAAGKTGTSNDNADAWFVGYTGRVLGLVWIGHDSPSHTLRSDQDGRRAALPLWRKLVEYAETERPSVSVLGPPPATVVQVTVDRETGARVQSAAVGGINLYFRKGTEPEIQPRQVHEVPRDLGRTSREF